MMLYLVTCSTVPFLTSVTVTGVTVVLVVIVAVPAIPGFSSCTDRLLPVDRELEVVGHRQFTRAFGQLDDQVAAVHGNDLELLGFRRG